MPVPPDPARLTNARQFLLSYSSAQLDVAMHLLSPGVSYTVPGTNALAGTCHGPAEVRGHLAKLLSMSNETYDVIKWVDWMVGDDHVAALQYAQIQRQHSIYRGHQLFLVGFDQDDLISEIRVFFEDQERADRFFT